MACPVLSWHGARWANRERPLHAACTWRHPLCGASGTDVAKSRQAYAANPKNPPVGDGFPSLDPRSQRWVWPFRPGFETARTGTPPSLCGRHRATAAWRRAPRRTAWAPRPGGLVLGAGGREPLRGSLVSQFLGWKREAFGLRSCQNFCEHVSCLIRPDDLPLVE